ncbi:MAG: hypothetical protein IPI60_02050 [Saprospiraceae bacterium]|nr:hypothetical protein [Saprospiraceae bacterium]
MYADKAKELNAFQYTLKWDPSAMQITELIPGKGMSAANFSTRHKTDGMLTVCWAGENGGLSEGEPAFTLVVMPKVNIAGLGEVFEITDEITEALSFFGTNNEKIPVISIQNQNHTQSNNYELFQNNPNPFSKETWITFKVPVDEMVTITVTDLTGKIVHQQKQFCLKGKHAVKVEFGPGIV